VLFGQGEILMSCSLRFLYEAMKDDEIVPMEAKNQACNLPAWKH